MLAPLGFTVFAASSGAECLALAEAHRPKLILLDVAMADMDGWEVGRELRRIRRERPAIIMLSAFAPDPKHKSEPNPVNDDYLIKPFDSAPVTRQDPCAAGHRVALRRETRRRATQRRRDAVGRDISAAAKRHRGTDPLGPDRLHARHRGQADRDRRQLRGATGISSLTCECSPMASISSVIWPSSRRSGSAMAKQEPRNIILVVDDSPNTLRMLTDAIEGARHDGSGGVGRRAGAFADRAHHARCDSIGCRDARDRWFRNLPASQAA